MHFCLCLGGGVVFGLILAHNERVFFVGVDEVGLRVVDHTGGGSVDEGFDACFLCYSHHRFRPINVDVVHDLFVLLRVDWAGGVDDGVGLELGEEFEHFVIVGDVAILVVYARDWARRLLEVKDGEFGACFAGVEQ